MINHAAPGVVRMQADEVTYDLHIIVRFELERALLSGDLRAVDLPDAWREMYMRTLGIAPRNDREGCLQDGHWAEGLIGYFPMYTMGNIYAAQFFTAAERDLGSLDDTFAAGNFRSLRDWLGERVYRQGSSEALRAVTETARPTRPDFTGRSLWAPMLTSDRIGCIFCNVPDRRFSFKEVFVTPTQSILIAALLTAAIGAAPASSQQAPTKLDAPAAARFAALALACVQKEYPNKIAHVLNSPEDVKAPHELTPAFYGCFDWHSSVHGHWLLARLVREFPQARFANDAMTALKTNITPAHIAGEVAYLKGDGRESFERPYGLAWLLQLGTELRESHTPAADSLSAALKPLEGAVVAQIKAWLPKLVYPIREGEHAQTAFAFGLILDYSRGTDPALTTIVEGKVRQFYLKDRDCPLNYEPSGQDFLSPCIAEADVMRRVLPPAEFARWLTAFLPRIPAAKSASWLPIGIVLDKTDGKLAHLDGLNLSRAWMLQGIASGLPSGDRRLPALQAAANTHSASGLAAVTGEHYAGGHWLGSFAAYLTTRRGIRNH